MSKNNTPEKLDELRDKYGEYYNPAEHWKHWRAWGSWFSWGSPVGLALFYALIIISTGIFIWLIHHK
jgi:hypothetical protein